MYPEFSRGKNPNSSGISGYAAVRPMPSLSVPQGQQEGETKRGNTGKSKKSSDPAKWNLCGYKEPVLHRVRISAQVNGRNSDHLLCKTG